MRTNIVLIGLPGSGKTTLGRKICDRDARFSFVDMDEEIVARVGLSIPHIFEQYGESYFRARESEAAETAAERHFAVIATGGGVVTVAQNMTRLRATGVVFYLRCGVAALHERTRGDANRPLLAAGEDGERLARLTALAAAREPLYRQYSDHTVITDAHASSADELAAWILHLGGIS